MNPIRFACTAHLPGTPESVAQQILDLGRWPSFTGYGVLPGIAAAVFEVRMPEVVGSRIRVTNTDGSNHVEEITTWESNRLRLELKEFSKPLSWLAARFVETWELERLHHATVVVRSFEVIPTGRVARPVLWLISRLLRRAVVRHLIQMGHAPTPREVSR